LRENSEYILPARFDDTKVPGLRSTIAYVDLRQVPLSEFVKLITEKVSPGTSRTKMTVAPKPDDSDTRLAEIMQPKDAQGFGHYFFLSYYNAHPFDAADRTDPNKWVRKFFNDLRESVWNLTTAAGNAVGYMDQGQSDEAKMLTAVAHCRVFVPLYSPRFFASGYCGRQWSAFVSRQAAVGEAIQAIVPVLWVPLESGQAT
jgi:hypothetical protein